MGHKIYDTTCSAPGCERPTNYPASGLCALHYQRMNKLGRLELEPRPVGVSGTPEWWFDKCAEFRRRCNKIKLWFGCTDCGYRDNPLALQFDHLPGTEKLFAIGQACGRSWPKVLAEIAKCEVVCANCHFIRTHDRRGERNRIKP